VSSSVKENGQPEVMPDNWPTKLMLQLIPKSVVQTIGGQYFKDSKSGIYLADFLNFNYIFQ
jgi:mediator of RNA polymerase II transcription subunit 25